MIDWKHIVNGFWEVLPYIGAALGIIGLVVIFLWIIWWAISTVLVWLGSLVGVAVPFVVVLAVFILWILLK